MKITMTSNLTFIGSGLAIAGIFLPAASVLGVDVTYWSAPGVGFEKNFLLAALIACIIVVVVEKRKWLRYTVPAAIISIAYPAIPKEIEIGEEPSVFGKVVDTVTSAATDVTTNFALDFLISVSAGSICLISGLVVLIVAMVYGFFDKK